MLHQKNQFRSAICSFFRRTFYLTLETGHVSRILRAIKHYSRTSACDHLRSRPPSQKHQKCPQSKPYTGPSHNRPPPVSDPDHYRQVQSTMMFHWHKENFLSFFLSRISHARGTLSVMPTLPTLREILPSPQASLLRAAKAFRVTWSKRIRDREGLLKRRNRAIVAFFSRVRFLLRPPLPSRL